VPILRARGFDVWGYEHLAGKTENFIVRHRGEISAKFDGIFSNNVIEHFRDPVAQFLDLATVLKPNGVMSHSTPCYEYRCHGTRFHTVFCLEDSIRVLARRTGFEVVSSTVPPSAYDLALPVFLCVSPRSADNGARHVKMAP
jgi:SAM-dependent methyltransferase